MTQVLQWDLQAKPSAPGLVFPMHIQVREEAQTHVLDPPTSPHSTGFHGVLFGPPECVSHLSLFFFMAVSTLSPVFSLL